MLQPLQRPLEGVVPHLVRPDAEVCPHPHHHLVGVGESRHLYTVFVQPRAVRILRMKGTKHLFDSGNYFALGGFCGIEF